MWGSTTDGGVFTYLRVGETLSPTAGEAPVAPALVGTAHTGLNPGRATVMHDHFGQAYGGVEWCLV